MTYWIKPVSKKWGNPTPTFSFYQPSQIFILSPIVYFSIDNFNLL